MKTTESGQMNQNTELMKRLEAQAALIEDPWHPFNALEAAKWCRAASVAISTQERVIVELREVLKLTNETLKEQAKRFNTINYSHSEIDAVVSMIDVALSKGSGQ